MPLPEDEDRGVLRDVQGALILEKGLRPTKLSLDTFEHTQTKMLVHFTAAPQVTEPIFSALKLAKAGASFTIEGQCCWMALGESHIPVVEKGGRTYLKIRVRPKKVKVVAAGERPEGATAVAADGE